ncbi:MAG: C-GCAxxG-C-C family protein [Promethearchaeota archaeon]
MGHDRRGFLKTLTSGVLSASLVHLSVSGGEKKSLQETDDNAPKSRSEKALSCMQKYGSCCSGVLAAYASEAGMDIDHAGAAGRGMAGGVGGLGSVCGAVSGAVMAIGLKMTNKENIQDMTTGLKVMEKTREFVALFEKEHSSIQCRDLIGYDISSSEKSALAMEEGAFANCPGYVESATKILDELFENL